MPKLLQKRWLRISQMKSESRTTPDHCHAQQYAHHPFPSFDTICERQAVQHFARSDDLTLRPAPSDGKLPLLPHDMQQQPTADCPLEHCVSVDGDRLVCRIDLSPISLSLQPNWRPGRRKRTEPLCE